MARPRGNSKLLVREALDSVVSPPVRDALLSSAIEQLPEREIPSDPFAFREFVCGPLRAVLAQGLGPELAESIADELINVARSGVRRTPQRPSDVMPATGVTPPHRAGRITPRRSSRPKMQRVEAPRHVAAPTPPPQSGTRNPLGSSWISDEYPSGVAQSLGLSSSFPPEQTGTVARPLVLVASRDPRIAPRFARLLGTRTEVAEVSSLRELLFDLDATDSKVALLLDCRLPSVRPSALAALADELPEHASVVLWNPTQAQLDKLVEINPAASKFVVCGPGVGSEDVASRCMDLVG
ncbi:MAG: hypothetical protein KC776_36945 [Myxococcales bacterium]|nr:hypothetical protein [Myxococcales bacterium]MCB9579656.1 hypothetical protein [Polyangiaceae bacterium]